MGICLIQTTRLHLNSSAASGAPLVTSSTGTSETPRSRSQIFHYVVSLFPPVFLHLTFTPGPSSLRPFWSGRQAQAWEWSPSSPSALHDRERASLPFYLQPFWSSCSRQSRAGCRV